MRGRRALLRRAAGATALVGAALALRGAAPVGAQLESDAAMNGSWLVSPTGVAEGLPILSMATFIQGGGFIATHGGQPGVSTGHGTWKQAGELDFDVTYLVLQTDPAGGAPGLRKIWLRVVLEPTGRGWSGQARGGLVAPDGSAAPDGSTLGLRATKIVAEPTPG